MMTRSKIASVIALTLFLMLTGCGRSPSPVLYTLEAPRSDTASVSPVADSFVLGLRQVGIPDVLKRPQLVLIENEQVNALELHRWSEPLDAAILRILAAELRFRLGTASILSYPWPKQFNPEKILTVSISHFSGLPGQDVELSGVWMLSTEDGSQPMRTVQFRFVENVSGDNYSDLVRAHSGALEQLVTQLAADLPGE